MDDAELPRQGRLLAIDYGHVRLGFAISDAAQTLASPYENYTRRDAAADATYLRRLVEDEQLMGIIVGLPVHVSGEESQKSHESRQFATWVREVTKTPVQLFDERYSSVAAEQFLLQAGLTSKQRKKRRDMLAAQVILASFLESTRRSVRPEPLDD